MMCSRNSWLFFLGVHSKQTAWVVRLGVGERVLSCPKMLLHNPADTSKECKQSCLLLPGRGGSTQQPGEAFAALVAQLPPSPMRCAGTCVLAGEPVLSAGGMSIRDKRWCEAFCSRYCCIARCLGCADCQGDGVRKQGLVERG